MKRLFAVLCLSAFLASHVDARPRHWYTDVWHFWVPAAASAGITAFQWQATNACRKRAGVESCFGGYAEHHGMEALVVATQVGGFALTQYGRSDDVGAIAWAPYVASNGIWLTNAILQTQHECHQARLECGLPERTLRVQPRVSVPGAF